MAKIAVYPGTFDPVTLGHTNIIKKASKLFDKVIVAVAANEEKRPKFSLKKRIELLKIATQTYENVEIKEFSTLLVNFAIKENAAFIIRGLRAISDFEYELQMGYANASLAENIETVYLMPNIENSFISSSIVRAIIKYDGEYNHLLPKSIHAAIREE